VNEQIIIPSMGATSSDVLIMRWFVEVGQRVEAGQPLAEVETDKAVVELESFRNGYVQQLLAKVGDTVSIGDAVAVVGDEPQSSAAHDAAADTGSGAVAATDRAEPDYTSQPLATQTAPADNLDAEVLTAMYRRMVLIRKFEDHLFALFLQGQVPGTLHQCQGQEAVSVGLSAALRRDDWAFSTHRPVGHLLAKGAHPRAIAAEIWGKVTGCSAGKGGQMHLQDMDVSTPPSNAIVGGNVPIAVGAGIAFRLRGDDRVAVSYFGDGAMNIGALHEGLNLAAVRDAPVIFACENNLYGASTHVSLATAIEDLADRAAAYGIRGVVVDGMNVLACYDAARAAVARARAGQGPTLIEFKTYRYPGHSRGDPQGYRDKKEVHQWRRRDPIKHCRQVLIDKYGLSEGEVDAIDVVCQAEVEDAVAYAHQSEDPSPESVWANVLAGENRPLHEVPTPAGASSRPMSMVEALRDAIRLAMQKDPAVFMLGEDIGITGGFGGGFTVSLGLSDEFGHDRILDTPISEIAIVGAAVGAAMVGQRPIAEMQYGDFVFCAMDQVVNQAAKMRYMSNGHVSVPMVLRLPVGASNRGAQHGQCSEAYFMHTAGLKVVCPSNSYDAKGLLLAAIRDDNPVVFLEHKLLYGAKGGRQEKASVDPTATVPKGDYEVPLGTVKLTRTGQDVTVLANMLMLHRVMAAANELAKQGVECEVIDIRCLVPLDMETIVQSVTKTNRVLIVEEDNLTGGWGAEVAARLSHDAIYQLEGPIVRLAAPDTPLPCAAQLEKHYVPSVDKILAAVRQTLEA